MHKPLVQLFQHASRQLQRSALAEFQRTPIGRLARDVSSLSKGRLPGGGVVSRLSRAAQQGPEALLRAAVGSELGSVVRMVERYSRGSSVAPEAVTAFLEELGPAGELLGLLAELSPLLTGGRMGRLPIKGKGPLARQFAAAIRFLQAFGYQVTPPAQGRRGRLEEQALEAARQLLEGRGYTVIPPSEEPEERLHLPEGIELRPGRKTVDVPLKSGQVKRVRPDDPVLTGQTVHVQSSNVHSYRYEYEAAALYVRFLGRRGDDSRGGPGPLYRYDNVEPDLALDLERAASKGGWVWDHLRIRGTISGHQKDYALVGVAGRYVPRKATMTAMGETYLPRTVRLPGGQWVQSKRPLAVVRPLAPVGVM